MRTAQRLAALLAVALAACSYPAETVGVTVQVDNIPATANALIVQVMDSAGQTKSYYPSLGAGAISSLQLSLAAPPTGVFTVIIQAQDPAKDDLADGTVSGDFQTAAAPIQLEVALSVSAQPGTFGAPCVTGVNGGPNTCGTGLNCLQYTAGDQGVCTQMCTTSCQASPAGASCQPAGAPPVSYCQWECTPAPGSGTNGVCPRGLVCRVAGSRSFCEGS